MVLDPFLPEMSFVTYSKGIHLYFLSNKSFVAFSLLSITAMLTEPVQQPRMESGGEKYPASFSLQLLSRPVLDGYNYYSKVDSGNKLKGRPSVSQGLEIQTAREGEGGSTQLHLWL